MPKRKVDPTTGEPELTYREQLLVDEYIRNGGNGAQAAAAAGYTAARLDQAAYQVLHRERVQQHVRERIRESRVSADEIIGTLVSHMRGNLTEFFDESGNFSIEIARKKGIGHLLKSISGTICSHRHPDAADLEPPNAPAPQRSNVQTCKRCNAPHPFRAQLHSPLQAASILARLIGPDRHRPYRGNQPATDSQARRDFDPNALLQSLIQEQMKEHGLSRDAVTNRILQVRPEFARYLDELPPPPGPLDDLSLRDNAKLLGVVLDTIASLRSTVSPADSAGRVVEAYQQIEAMSPMLAPNSDPSGDSRHSGSDDHDITVARDSGPAHSDPDRSDSAAPLKSQISNLKSPATAPADFDPAPAAAISYDDLTAAIDRITARLSQEERDRLIRLQLKSLIHQKMSHTAITEAGALDAIRRQAADLASDPDHKLPCDPVIIDDAITDYFDQPTIDNGISDMNQTQLEIDHSHAKPASAVQPEDSTPAPSDNLQLATCNLQPTPDPAALDAFNRKYSTIDRPFRYGQLNNHFTEVIHQIMKDQSLTPQQAIDAMWLEARQDTWFSAELVDRCIADYAALHPRLAHAQPPVSTARPPSPPRYYRPVPPETSTPPNAFPGHITDDSGDSTILTSTQLFNPAIRPPPVRRRRDG